MTQSPVAVDGFQPPTRDRDEERIHAIYLLFKRGVPPGLFSPPRGERVLSRCRFLAKHGMKHSMGRAWRGPIFFLHKLVWMAMSHWP